MIFKSSNNLGKLFRIQGMVKTGEERPLLKYLVQDIEHDHLIHIKPDINVSYEINVKSKYADTLAYKKEYFVLELIGINYKDTKINAKNFLAELGNPFKKIIFDDRGINAIEWGAYGVPESYLIKNGIIIKKYIGPLNKTLFNEINFLVK